MTKIPIDIGEALEQATSYVLDVLVHDVFRRLASACNSRGRDAQLDCLIKNGVTWDEIRDVLGISPNQPMPDRRL